MYKLENLPFQMDYTVFKSLIFTQKVCCWGRNVFMGYLNKENDTKEVFTDDNWLTLSDLGYMDEDKFLSVVGRMEDFVTLKSEEVISPIRVNNIN